ncbi:sphingomyelin phosphodiesterase 4-like isoform X3 [Limulus polyphemus]|uniref:Sphingomyelin phosphodiesterase 4-like isoform X3 n=1 Tax=Limulus polyphemus TaxID=6850 RepID=A0ABM1T0R2_LIMPO|nr:sphingomyelin phosphodiesterase 4-like isoform X3 [Limulus polyphemus]
MGWKGILQLYSILPHMVQKKLYKFFRLCFDRWPCDSSLSFPLEMWLSYIQPWKYISHRVGSLSVDSEKENRDGFVNVKWKKFISENLCFYTVIFQQLLPKFFQVDLSSPENASMLFHLAKVFSKPNLGTVISEVESNFCKAPVCLLSPSFSSVNTPPPLMHNASVCGSLRQQLMNLEGPGFDYKPFFGEYQTSQVHQLLQLITQARIATAGLIKLHEASRKGWFSQLISCFNRSDTSFVSVEYNAVETKKVELYLEYTAIQLCELFQLEIPSVSLRGTSLQEKTPDTVPGPNGPCLTPLGRYQLVNRIHKFPFHYQENPDLQPIRNYEITFLVRLLHQISTAVNKNALLDRHNLQITGLIPVAERARPFNIGGSVTVNHIIRW